MVPLPVAHPLRGSCQLPTLGWLSLLLDPELTLGLLSPAGRQRAHPVSSPAEPRKTGYLSPSSLRSHRDQVLRKAGTLGEWKCLPQTRHGLGMVHQQSIFSLLTGLRLVWWALFSTLQGPEPTRVPQPSGRCQGTVPLFTSLSKIPPNTPFSRKI